MPLTLRIDAARWRAHQEVYVATAGGPSAVVPVVKGNGYGPGRAVVAAEAVRLAVPAVAVGTYDELADVARRVAPADVVVMTPWRPGQAGSAVLGEQVIHTVSRLEDLAALAASAAQPRVVVELLTSMRRHGIDPAQLAEVVPLLDGVRFEGWSLHLPLSRTDPVAEAVRLGALARAHRDGPLWVSHVPPGRLREVGGDVRLRTGTGLWLAGHHAMRWTATVIDVHRLRRGDTYGYRQRAARRDATLLVVAGGTSHGIGLAGPAAAVMARQRAAALARGALEAVGHVRSPYRLDRAFLAFAEPPHMQCSMVWAPPGAAVAVGDELDAAVRYPTTYADEVTLM